MRWKIVNVAAFVSGNLGDDLFVKILCQKYDDVHFVLSGPKKFKKFFLEIDNLHYFNNDTLFIKVICKLINIVRKYMNKNVIYRHILVKNILAHIFKINVMIAGSMFTETPTRLIELEMDKAWYSRNPILIGCNYGSNKSQAYYKRCRELFSKAKHISFRDRFSYDLFSDLGNVTCAPDIIFNLVHNTDNLGYYVVSVMDLYIADYYKWEDYASGYLSKIVDIINSFTKREIRVVLVSFCESMGDTNAIHNIVNMLDDNKNIEICEYSNSGIDEVLNLISNCSGIIATRFHSLVLGILFEKLVYPVIYSDKMYNLLRDINIEGEDYWVDRFVKKDICNIQYEFIDFSTKNIDDIIHRSSEHFNPLNSLLKNKGTPRYSEKI